MMKTIIDTVRNDPNDHYGTRHHKYTINIPLELMKQAQIRSKAAGFNEVAPYFRAILSREICRGSLTLSDIIGEKEIRKQHHLTNQRRIEIESHNHKNSFKEFSCKIKKLMLSFRSNKDQQFFEF